MESLADRVAKILPPTLGNKGPRVGRCLEIGGLMPERVGDRAILPAGVQAVHILRCPKHRTVHAEAFTYLPADFSCPSSNIILCICVSRPPGELGRHARHTDPGWRISLLICTHTCRHVHFLWPLKITCATCCLWRMQWRSHHTSRNEPGRACPCKTSFLPPESPDPHWALRQLGFTAPTTNPI